MVGRMCVGSISYRLFSIYIDSCCKAGCTVTICVVVCCSVVVFVL